MSVWERPGFAKIVVSKATSWAEQKSGLLSPLAFPYLVPFLLGEQKILSSSRLQQCSCSSSSNHIEQIMEPGYGSIDFRSHLLFESDCLPMAEIESESIRPMISACPAGYDLSTDVDALISTSGCRPVRPSLCVEFNQVDLSVRLRLEAGTPEWNSIGSSPGSLVCFSCLTSGYSLGGTLTDELPRHLQPQKERWSSSSTTVKDVNNKQTKVPK